MWSTKRHGEAWWHWIDQGLGSGGVGGNKWMLEWLFQVQAPDRGVIDNHVLHGQILPFWIDGGVMRVVKGPAVNVSKLAVVQREYLSLQKPQDGTS